MRKYIVTHWHDFQHHFHHENPHVPKPHGEVEMTPAQEKHFKMEGLRVILGAFLIHFVLGCFYLWGGISLYVASYLRRYDSESIDIDLVKMVFPFMNVAINAVTSFGVKLADRITHQIVCFLGIIIIAGAVFAVSYIKTFVPFLLIYAILLGLSSGLVYMVPVVCGWKYFPSKKGLISGFIIAGYGFGSLSFNQIALKIVNPDNLKASIEDEEKEHKYFTEDVYDNVPKMFRILALLYLVIGLIGAALIKFPYATPKNHHTQEPAHNLVKDKQTGKMVDHPHVHVDCERISDAVKTRPFWLLILMVFCGSYFGLLMANNYKVYGLEQLDDDDFVTLVGSIGSACNGCSRLIWAALFDKFGFKRVYFCLMSIQIVLAATLHHISETKGLYMLWYALIMATEGGQFSMMPAVTAKVFGYKKGPLIYGFIFFSFAVANMGSFFTTKFGLEDMGWGAIFWLCFGLSCGAFILNLIFNENFDDFRVVKRDGHKLAEVQETHELQMAHDDHDDHHDSNHDDSPAKKI